MSDIVNEPIDVRDPTRIHPSVALTIAKTIDSYGIDSRALFAHLGVNKDKDLTNEKRVVGSVNDAIWRAALKASGDDGIGIKFVKHFQIGSLGGLGFSWAASNSVLEAFTRLSRYFAVISSAGKIVIDEEVDIIKVALVLPVPYGVAADSGVDSALALFVHLSRILLGEELSPKKVHFQRPKPNNHAVFDDFFRSDINYDMALNEVVFEKKDMLQALPISNPELARVNEQCVSDYMKRLENENFASKVSSIITEDLPLGTPCQVLIAQKLNISGKTLQRRLKAEQTTFSSLLNDIRNDQAKKYLTNKWRSISEISYLLGFTEPSNFARWFKDEFGISPVQYRKDQKGE